MYTNPNIREVTIGRAKNADICLDRRCIYASSYHATLYMDGSQLMYKDTSTNGSLINNVSVRHRAIPIKQGDIIMVAGLYQISWNQINYFFPSASRHSEPSHVKPVTVETVVPEVHTPNTTKWSWGAFQFSWIWGLFNGCWWILLIQLFLIILSFIPIVNIFSGIASIVMSIVYGVNGRQWAWDNRSWRNVLDFEETQDTWNKWGLIFFIGSIVLSILIVIFFGAALLTYVSQYY